MEKREKGKIYFFLQKLPNPLIFHTIFTMYSLYILFFTLPLYFSHVFMHFGMVMGDSVSFERQKMYLFILCILLVLVEYIIRRP